MCRPQGACLCVGHKELVYVSATRSLFMCRPQGARARRVRLCPLQDESDVWPSSAFLALLALPQPFALSPFLWLSALLPFGLLAFWPFGLLLSPLFACTCAHACACVGMLHVAWCRAAFVVPSPVACVHTCVLACVCTCMHACICMCIHAHGRACVRMCAHMAPVAGRCTFLRFNILVMILF